MPFLNIPVFLVCILIILPVSLFGTDSPDLTTDFYQKGMAEIGNGNPEQAVAVWLQGWSELNLASETDPRIAFSLIEKVAEMGMVQLYQQAAHIYLWGFQGDEIGRWSDVYREELLRLKPLVTGTIFNQWQQMLEDENPELFDSIRFFWDSLDPMPATGYNPRVAEHWERIAYARLNYVMNDLSVYGTDERGLIHVKYGAPDQIHMDTFRAVPSQMLQLIRQVYILDREYGRALANAVESRAFTIVRESRYLIWTYFFENRELTFYFGQPKGTDPFQMIDSLLDLLPTNYNRYATYYDTILGRIRFNAGPFLVFSAVYQASLYDSGYMSELSSFYGDESFGMRQDRGRVEQLYYQSNIASIRKRNRADIQVSWLDRNLATLPVSTQTWRFLDQQQQQYLVTAFFTELPDVYVYDSSDEIQLLSRNTWTIRTMDQLLCQAADLHHIEREELELIHALDNTITSLINCPYEPEAGLSVFTTELFDFKNQGVDDELLRPAFTGSLPGLKATGRRELEPVELLADDLGDFIVSDIVLGVPTESGGLSMGDLRLIPDNLFPVGEDLILFYEIYNLDENPRGQQEYTLEYEIRPVRNRLQRLFGVGREDREMSILLTFETPERWSSDQIEVELAGLRAREYEIFLTFTDSQSGRTIERTRRFTLVDTKE